MNPEPASASDDGSGDKPAPYSFDGLDRVLHEKARLGILTSLLAHRDGLVFNELRELCALTDGNLSRHLQTLEEAGLVKIVKGTKGRRPQTLVKLTPAGSKRFLDYLNLLEGIVSEALGNVAPQAAPKANPMGWNPA